MKHAQLSVLFFLTALAGAILHGILFVVFGEVTVRKLRKNPQTRHLLGMQFVSGMDIVNVSVALSRPRRWSPIMEGGKLGFLFADSAVLRANTSRLDRAIARLHFWSLVLSGVLMTVWLGFEIFA